MIGSLIQAAVVVIRVKLVADPICTVDFMLVILGGCTRHALAVGVVHGAQVNGALDRDVIYLFPVQFAGVVWPLFGGSKYVCSRVGSAKTEGRHTRVTRIVPVVAEIVGENSRVASNIQVGVQFAKMAVRCPSTCRTHHHALDDTSSACTSLQVTNVCLGTGLNDGHNAVLHDSTQGTNLDGVTQSCACAMAFSTRNLVCGQPSLVHGPTDAFLLSRTVRGSHAGTPSILIQAGPNHCCEAFCRHDVLVLDVESTVTLTTHETIGRVVKREASPQR
mmetsp:Transcript_87113/g.211370  ORF Transcript_87113/g.211370 Transcript_87113/m.211370 type:complete len:276 (+) Transcript_87113:1565-2392(+)